MTYEPNNELWERTKFLLERFSEAGAPMSTISAIDSDGEGGVLPTALIPIIACALEQGAVGHEPAVIRGDYPFRLQDASFLINIQPEVLELIVREKLQPGRQPDDEVSLTAKAVMDEFLDMWTLEMLGMLRALTEMERKELEVDDESDT